MNLKEKPAVNEPDTDVMSRNLLFMGVFIFLISIGEGLTAPAIPLYGDKLGASYQQLGFLMAGYSVTYMLMTVTSGRISDIIGRKQILLVSISLSVVAGTGYYFASLPKTLLIFRTIEGMSRGILWPIAEAIVADNTNYGNRGQAMGRFTAAYGAGVTIGTLAGGYIMEYINLTAVFPFFPILAAITFVTTLFGLTDISPEDRNHGSSEDEENLESSSYLEEIKKIWPVCYIGFVYAGFLYSLWGLLSKVADSFGVSLMGIGVIFASFWGMRLVAFLICGRSVETFGRRRVLLVGLGFGILATGTFLIADDFWLLIFGAAMGGISTGIIFPVGAILIADFSSPEYHGFGMGCFEFGMGIGMIIQTSLSGILGDLGGANLTYLFTFISFVAAIPLSMKYIYDKQKEKIVTQGG